MGRTPERRTPCDAANRKNTHAAMGFGLLALSLAVPAYHLVQHNRARRQAIDYPPNSKVFLPIKGQVGNRHMAGLEFEMKDLRLDQGNGATVVLQHGEARTLFGIKAFTTRDKPPSLGETLTNWLRIRQAWRETKRSRSTRSTKRPFEEVRI